MSSGRLVSADEARAMAREHPTCAGCEKRPATCCGYSESETENSCFCDECCGHGNEDGHCEPIRVALARTVVAQAEARDNWREALRYCADRARELVAPHAGSEAGAGDDVVRALDALENERIEAREEIARLRAIALGSTVPPTRDEVRRHHVEHNGYWLVSRVREGRATGSWRPMVLRILDSDLGPIATIPGTDYGGTWGDDPWRLMQGATWTPLDADGRLLARAGADVAGAPPTAEEIAQATEADGDEGGAVDPHALAVALSTTGGA